MFSEHLINYWSFNGHTNDEVGNAHLFNLTNATFTQDRFGRANSAISFSNGYAQVPSGVYFTREFTIMAWIKPREATYWPRILDFGVGMRKDNILLTYSSYSRLIPQLAIVVNSDVDLSMGFNTSIKLNEWVHIAVSKSSTEFRAYLNGTLVNNSPSVRSASNVTRTSNYIGKSNWDVDSLANADMDDIKIFNTALNDHQIKLQSY